MLAGDFMEDIPNRCKAKQREAEENVKSMGEGEEMQKLRSIEEGKIGRKKKS